MKDLIEENPRQTISEICRKLETRYELTRGILKDHLRMTKVSSAWVPYNLTQKNKTDRVLCCQSLLQLFDEFTIPQLLKQMVIIDETRLSLDMYLEKLALTIIDTSKSQRFDAAF